MSFGNVIGAFALAIAPALVSSPVRESAPVAGAATASPAVLSKAPPPPARVCRKMVPTGSIMPIKVCLTKGEWREMNDRTETSAEDAMRHRGTGMCDINCAPSGN